MKRIIRITLFSILLAVAISSTLISALSQKMNGINLAEIYTLNLASAEDGPKYTVLYYSVNCQRSTVTNSDGTTTTVHQVTCYGAGNNECKCSGH
jgi:hypothetical protein